VLTYVHITHISQFELKKTCEKKNLRLYSYLSVLKIFFVLSNVKLPCFANVSCVLHVIQLKTPGSSNSRYKILFLINRLLEKGEKGSSKISR